LRHRQKFVVLLTPQKLDARVLQRFDRNGGGFVLALLVRLGSALVCLDASRQH